MNMSTSKILKFWEKNKLNLCTEKTISKLNVFNISQYLIFPIKTQLSNKRFEENLPTFNSSHAVSLLLQSIRLQITVSSGIRCRKCFEAKLLMHKSFKLP